MASVSTPSSADKALPNNAPTEESLRQMFRYFNRFMLLMWRLDMGWWFTLAPRLTGQIMVITHTGRKSGLQRRTPLNYALIDGELYCTAGFGEAAHWYRNILANPQVEVWLADGRWLGIAEDITEQPNNLERLRQVLIGSGFAAFAAGINPYKLSDTELADLTKAYRLIHIHRTAPATEGQGPGDLRWVWQVVAFALLFMLMGRPVRKPRRKASRSR
ncbi:MAG: nitroreductase family deazaflavin-dependent oxidoreductase [Anaerolineae bacterium]